MDSEVYHLFARATPFILIWIMGFVALTIVTLAWRHWKNRNHFQRDSMVGGEMPGILLVLMHSVCCAYSVYRHDWISALVFGWWGPGFLVIATLVLTKHRVDWQRIAHATSITCKLNYIVLVGLFIHYGDWAPIFAYSLWIMHDQVRLAWFQQNADRTRRVFEDRWLPRVCYPGFLILPFVIPDFPFRWISAGAALIVIALWVWGILRLIQMRFFFSKPRSFSDNLRDIVYLPKHHHDLASQNSASP